MIARGIKLKLVFLLAGALAWFALSGCASQSKEDGSVAASEPGSSIKVRAGDAVDVDDLRAAARREFRSFDENRRRADLEDAAYSMQAQLRSEGHHFARVRFETVPEEGEIESATLIVEEGPVATTGEVEIQVDKHEVEDELRIKPRSYFKHLHDEPYREGGIKAAMSELESAFLLEGFYDVEVEYAGPRFNDERTTTRPLVKVKMGSRYEMKFESPEEDLPPGIREIAPEWDRVDDDNFHVRRPAELAGRLRNALLDLGHQLAEVRPETEIDQESNEARVRLKVAPGPQLILRDLVVSGLDPEVDRTDPEFIREVFDLEKGSVLSQEEIDAGVGRLYETGIFGRVNAKPNPSAEVGTSDPLLADLDIALQELDSRSVDFELGFGSYELLRAGVHYTDRNLFGRGRVLEGSLRGSLKSGLFETVYTDPYSLGLKNRLVARVGAEFRDEPSFNRRSAFAGLEVQRELSRYATLSGGYQFRFSDVTLEGSSEDEFDEEGASRQAGLFVAFRYDDRDSPVLPVGGTAASARVFWSTPALLGALHFLDFSVGATHYLPLWSTAVLALGARFTTKQILNDDQTLPIQERLFLGGDTSVRSFGESELGPVDANNEPRGGLTSAEVHVELRQKVVDNFHVAAFYDGGIVNEDSFDLSGPYGHAIGLGFRYYLPVGPVRLDFAYNPGERFAADSDFMVHFGFGFTF